MFEFELVSSELEGLHLELFTLTGFAGVHAVAFAGTLEAILGMRRGEGGSKSEARVLVVEMVKMRRGVTQ